MDQIWLKSYPQGVPAVIEPAQYQSLVHLLEESFKKFASRNAYVCMDAYLTYGELDEFQQTETGKRIAEEQRVSAGARADAASARRETEADEDAEIEQLADGIAALRIRPSQVPVGGRFCSPPASA